MFGAQEASQEPQDFLGSALATSEVPLGKLIRSRAFLGGPGSAKGGQGFKFDGETPLILTIPFFAPSAFWKVPRGSRERVRRPGWPPRRSLERGRGSKRSLREAKNERSLFFWSPRGAQIGTSFEKVDVGKRGASKVAILLGTEAKSDKSSFFQYLPRNENVDFSTDCVQKL